MIKIYKVLLAGLVLLMAQMTTVNAASSAGDSIYQNCVDSVVFELKKKISSNASASKATISIRWTKDGMLFATYSENGRDADFGPDSAEDVMFKLERQVTSDVTAIKESLVYKMCHSVKN